MIYIFSMRPVPTLCWAVQQKRQEKFFFDLCPHLMQLSFLPQDVGDKLIPTAGEDM